jgi:hypothetical protein
MLLSKINDTLRAAEGSGWFVCFSVFYPHGASTLMFSWWNLDKYFGENFNPGQEDIHVFVELPKTAAGAASETSAMAQMVKEIYDHVVQTKCTQYVHSSMGSSDGRKLLHDLNSCGTYSHSPFCCPRLNYSSRKAFAMSVVNTSCSPRSCSEKDIVLT